MKVCVLGAGAVGSWLAAKLAAGGEDVTLVARGAQLAAIAANGIELDEGKFGNNTVRVSTLAGDLASAEGCDVIVVALKSYQLAAVAEQLGTLASKGAFVLSLQNGVPWWFAQGNTSRSLESVDPGGKLLNALPQRSVAGGVIYVASEVTAPGRVKVAGRGRLVLGEPDGRDSPRLQMLAALLQRCGIAAEVVGDIRKHVWAKLWRNAAFNPVSCITRATLGDIASDTDMVPVVTALLDEVAQVAAAYGVTIDETAASLISATTKFGAHKTSMLQDLERGRPLELGAMVGAVIELAQAQGIAVPHLTTVYACARLAEKTARASTH